MRTTRRQGLSRITAQGVHALRLGCISMHSIPFTMSAQDGLYVINERLLLELPLVDASYAHAAATMACNTRLGLASGGSTSPTFGDWLSGHESHSMQQALAITKDLHGTNDYFTNKRWDHLLRPTSRKSCFLNRVVASAKAGIVDHALEGIRRSRREKRGLGHGEPLPG